MLAKSIFYSTPSNASQTRVILLKQVDSLMTKRICGGLKTLAIGWWRILQYKFRLNILGVYHLDFKLRWKHYWRCSRVTAAASFTGNATKICRSIIQFWSNSLKKFFYLDFISALCNHKKYSVCWSNLTFKEQKLRLKLDEFIWYLCVQI